MRVCCASTLDWRVTVLVEEIVLVRRADGRQERFDRRPDGSYGPPRGGPYEPHWGVRGELARSDDGRWRLTLPDRRWLAFSAAGDLEQVGDHNGNALVLERDGQGRVARMVGAGGRCGGSDGDGISTRVRPRPVRRRGGRLSSILPAGRGGRAIGASSMLGSAARRARPRCRRAGPA
jgi:hypothetical protein